MMEGGALLAPWSRLPECQSRGTEPSAKPQSPVVATEAEGVYITRTFITGKKCPNAGARTLVAKGRQRANSGA